MGLFSNPREYQKQMLTRLRQVGAYWTSELAAPPQHVSWTVRLGGRWEFLSPDGGLLFWTRYGSWEVHNASDNALVAMHRSGSGPGLLLESDQRRTLQIDDVATRLQLSRVNTTKDPFQYQVDLLPPGRINSTVVDRVFPAHVRDAVRALAPITYQVTGSGTGELRTAGGVPAARDRFAHWRAAGHGGMLSELTAWHIDVMDNALPAAWLAGVLLAVSNLRSAQTRTADTG